MRPKGRLLYPILNRFLIVTLALTSAFTASRAAGDTRTGPPLQFEEYKVLFTNPECALYRYPPEKTVLSNSGEKLSNKPHHAFCKSSDAQNSANRAQSPQAAMLEWVNNPETKEVFFAYFTFSNAAVLDALCSAVSQRNLKIKFVLDVGIESDAAKKLLSCKPASGNPADAPELFLRGGNGRLQHFKFFMANPNSPRMQIAFGSGNLSSGLTLHHENWHFITLSENSYFARSHRCASEALIENGTNRKAFSDQFNACQKRIEFPEEGDIRAFFAPTQGKSAENSLVSGIENAQDIFVAVHRFSHKRLIATLDTMLKGPVTTQVRFLGDDDLYWVGHGQRFEIGNSATEYADVAKLERAGMRTRYVETNSRIFQFHHNKFFFLDTDGTQNDAVFTGAGNFTGAAFKSNFENFYHIRIPHVVEAFRTQMQHLWEDLATAPENLPATFVEP